MEIRIVLEEMWFRFSKEKNIKQKILLAQLQLKGVDIGQSSLSALEGQRREASDGSAGSLPDLSGAHGAAVPAA